MPLIGHLYFIWISSFESTWLTFDFHTIYSRFYLLDFVSFECKNDWFLLLNWNWQLLGIVLNYFGWLLGVLGGWKGEKSIWIPKIWFKWNKSDFLFIYFFFNQKITNLGKSGKRSKINSVLFCFVLFCFVLFCFVFFALPFQEYAWLRNRLALDLIFINWKKKSMGGNLLDS